MKPRFIFVILSFLSASTFAQSPSPQWGTANDIALRIPAAAFIPYTGFAVWDSNGSGEKYRTDQIVGGTEVFTAPYLDASLMLPRGAKITAITFDYCDTNITFGVTGYLQQVDEPTGANQISYPPSGVTSSGAPGCTSMGVDLTSYNIVINNLTTSYWVRFALDTADSTTKLRGATVFYRLQVSPAPATATFSDVPTSHVFFQYIEALAASGITTGCSAPPNPNYCPDAPLTRGQMAVFLSRALGLHWAP